MNSTRRFTLISWGVTILLVLGAGAFTVWRMQNPPLATPEIIARRAQSGTPAAATIQTGSNVYLLSLPAMRRGLVLKTTIPERPRSVILEHTVERGDSLFAIAKDFGIKPDSLLWSNFDLLNGSFDSLRPGQELNIPATDGILYKWKKDDTLVKVAGEFKADPQDVIEWIGNDLDLTNPVFKAGDLVMIPGGRREYVDWLPPVAARGRSGTANLGGSACNGGPVGGGGFVWPADNHFLSGNDYTESHRGIDIAAGTGANIYASDSGVVVLAGGVASGYGNVIYIDHGNGYSTVYGHLSQINVSVCQGVSRGQLIGLSGSTGNSTGAHLHFEVRRNGGFNNPWSVLGQ